MTILETERLVLREIVENDAPFIFELLNTPSFKKYIGDRGVRSVEDAACFINDRYRRSYHEHGYGLFAVELNTAKTPVGICGFVRRDSLPGPDLGFAFLPEFEGSGYGFESSSAIMKYGRDVLGFDKVLAITSTDNEISGKLLAKLGFNFEGLIDVGGEKLKLFQHESIQNLKNEI